MSFSLYVFLALNTCLWVGQTYLDITSKKVMPLLAYLSLPVAGLMIDSLSLISFAGLPGVVFLHFTSYMAKGDTKLMLQYLASTIPFPVIGFQTLLFSSAIYILCMEKFSEEHYPIAPAAAMSWMFSSAIFLLRSGFG